MGPLLLFALPGILPAMEWRPWMGVPLTHRMADSGERQEGYNWNIVWDADGLAYIGGDRLWRWDGSRLEPMGPDIFGYLRGMAFDPQGRLWLGGVNQLGWIDTESGHYESVVERIPAEYRNFGPVWIIHHDGEQLWVGSNDRLIRIRENGVKVYTFEGKHRVIFHFLPQGVFAHEAGIGLWEVNDENLVLRNQEAIFALDSIIYLDTNTEGDLLGISKNGFFNLDSGDFKIKETVPFLQGNEVISCAVKIAPDKVAIGSLGQGVFVYNEHAELLYHHAQTGESGGSLVLNLKFVPEVGLLILSDQSVVGLNLEIPAGLISKRHGLSNTNVNDLAVSDGKIGLAKDDGFYAGTPDGFGTLVNKISDGFIGDVCSINDIFLLYRYDKIYWFDGDSLSALIEFEKQITTFTCREDGVLVVGFNDGIGLYRIGEGMEVEELGLMETGRDFSQLEADGAGRIWGWSPYAPLLELTVEADGAYETAWHEEADGHRLAEAASGLSVTESGPVLVFEDSLARLREDGRWQAGPVGAGLGMPEATAFMEEGEMLFGWLIHWDDETGTYLMREASWESGKEPEVRILPWVDMRGLGKISRMAVTGDPGRFFLIGGLRGLMVAARDLPEHVPGPAKPVIFAGDGSLRAEELILPYGQAVEPIRFTSPGSDLYYPVRYETRLSGRSEEWSRPGSLTQKELGQMLEGRYTFAVRAVDPFGRRSPAATFPLQVLPPWYRTPVALVGFVLLLVILVYGFVRLSERRLRVRQSELEALVELRTAELKRANEFKDDFIANLSHEIRNPLNGVIGFIREMKPGVAPPENYLKALRGAAHYLQTTVEEVLDFSKLQTGELVDETSLFDLQEMVTGVVEIYRDTASGKGIDLSSQIRVPAGMGIYSEARKIQQVIGNLTSNAVKFTQTGGVHVGVQVKEEGDGRGLLRLWVEDTGPGVAEADKERIFDKFYQVRSGVAKTSGTGLGLALVKRFVESLGGRIELKTAFQEGSTFVVTIPVVLKPLATVEEGASKRIPELEGMRVLVVEDIEYNRLVMEGLLTGLGCTVESVERGEPGLVKALENRFDVIFLDWDLPDTTGLEIARRLRADGDFSQATGIVGMTAFATTEGRSECLDAGMDDFLTKPISPDQLRGILLSFAGGRTLIEGRGLLGEMAVDSDWEGIASRWAGFLDTYVKELAAAVESGDAETARKAAHRLLGHLRMVAMRDLPETVRDLLTAAHAGDMEGVRKEWIELLPLVGRLREELDGFKQS